MIKRTLYFGNEFYLKCRNEQLILKKPESGEEKSVPVEDIGILIIDHYRITITSVLLNKLLKNNTAIITCNEKHMPLGMFLNLDGHSRQQLHFEAQIQASLPLKKRIWKYVIQQKIRNQEKLLEQAGVKSKRLAYLAEKVKSGDPENHEGQAAFYYWNHLFGDFSDNFIRGRYEDPPNDLLNYGYAVLRAIVARSLVASGLLPTLGIYHHNQYNAYCLADDVMEPYRPFVDALVLDILENNQGANLNDKNTKAALLQVPVIDVNINKRNSPLMNAVQQTTASLVECYTGKRSIPKLPVMN